MKSVYCLLFVLLASVLPLAAQFNPCEGEGGWLPVGEGLGELHPGHVFEINGEVWVVSLSEIRREFVVSAWNGSIWGEITTVPNGAFVRTATVYNNELYVATAWDHPNNIDSAGVLKWNGTEWERIVTTQEDQIIQLMTEYQGKLIVAGKFTEIGDVHAPHIVTWNGTQWEPLGSELVISWQYPSTTATIDRSIRTLFVYHDDLYVGAGSSFRLGENANTSSIVVWNGKKWSALENSDGWSIDKFAVYRDTLYASVRDELSWSRIVKRVGAEWVEAYKPELRAYYSDIAVYNDRLYVASWVRGLYMSRYNGSEWQTVKGSEGAGYFALAGGALYLRGGVFSSCEGLHFGIARFCDDESCGQISGTVFHDANSDCIKNNNEQIIGNRIVRTEPGGFHAIVNQWDGTYSILVPPGSYTVSVNQRNYWQQSCPTSGTYSVEISEPAQYATGNNFAFTATQDVQVLNMSIAGGLARPGRDVMYSIRYENVGTLPFTGTISMTYDPVLIYNKSMTTATRHTANELEWDISGLPVGMSGVMRVYFTLPPDPLLVGDIICCSVQATPDQQGDPLNDADYSDEECIEVRSSYDPNMIVVSPRGTVPEGFISPKDTVLHYVIHFQNTGNDTAFKVVLFDKLPEQLDLLTLRPGASSHPYEMDITDEGELRWVFHNIMLPDSNANEKNSHGYVKYEIQLKKGLPLGTEIWNAADIYFDYNEAVRTNEVKNVIHELSTGVVDEETFTDAIYPNPANDRVTITSTSLVAGEIVVYNNLGEAVLVVHHAGGAQVNLSIYSLAPGVYYVSYPIAGGALGRALTIVR